MLSRRVKPICVLLQVLDAFFVQCAKFLLTKDRGLFIIGLLGRKSQRFLLYFSFVDFAHVVHDMACAFFCPEKVLPLASHPARRIQRVVFAGFLIFCCSLSCLGAKVHHSFEQWPRWGCFFIMSDACGRTTVPSQQCQARFWRVPAFRPSLLPVLPFCLPHIFIIWPWAFPVGAYPGPCPDYNPSCADIKPCPPLPQPTIWKARWRRLFSFPTST